MTRCAAVHAQAAPCRAAAQLPAISGVPASKENSPMRAGKLFGSTSVRMPRVGQYEGSASRETLVGSSATHSSHACAMKSR